MVLSGLATIFGLFFLTWILWTTLSKGIDAIGPHLFTQMTPPPGEVSGGMLNALVGSFMMCLLAVLMAAPIGIAAGTYLAEYVNHHWLGDTIRFVNDILLSAPSIVLGLFVFTILVQPTGGFSGYAGAIALGFIVLPVVVVLLGGIGVLRDLPAGVDAVVSLCRLADDDVRDAAKGDFTE